MRDLENIDKENLTGMERDPAKNSQGAKDLFYSRLQYLRSYSDAPDIPILPDGPAGHDHPPTSIEREFPTPIDMWYDFPLYGKIDYQGRAVYNLPESSMKPFSSSEIMFGIDFVVDAFENMRQQFDNLKGKNLIADIGPISSLAPKGAWQSSINLHQNHLDDMKDYFIQTYMDPNADKILKWSDVFRWYAVFLRQHAGDFPMSLTGFTLSTLCPNRSSGLVIDLLQGKHGDDTINRQMLDSDSFDIYMNLATKHGFKLNKNAPWSLVADLTSGPMREYMKQYGVLSTKDYFKEYCYPTYRGEIKIIKDFILHCYLEFSERYPSFVEEVKCGNKMKKSVKRRKVLTPREFLDIVPESEWTELYIMTRFYETGGEAHHLELERLLKNAKFIRGPMGNEVDPISPDVDRTEMLLSRGYYEALAEIDRFFMSYDKNFSRYDPRNGISVTRGKVPKLGLAGIIDYSGKASERIMLLQQSAQNTVSGRFYEKDRNREMPFKRSPFPEKL